MRRILKVAWREYVETTKTKTFLLGVLATPAIIGLILYVASRVERHAAGPQPAKHVAVTDLSGELSDEIKQPFENYNSSHPQRQFRLQQVAGDEGSRDQVETAQKDTLRRGQLDMYVVLDADVVAGGGKMRLYTRATKAADVDVVSIVRNLLQEAVVNRRCKLRDVAPELLAELRRGVPSEHVEVGAAAEEERVRSESQRIIGMMVPFFFMFLMFMGIFGMGQHLITSVIEEKNSRVIEVLLSALSPLELMAGKIAGLGGIALTVIAMWGVGAYAAARWRGLDLNIPVEILPYFFVYYVLGFLLFSSILAGIGSVCNTIKEAQGLMMPVSMLCILPMVTWFALIRNPTGTLARAMSFVPPLTPMVMILRLAAGAELTVLEVAASIVILAGSVLVAVWAGAKVFHIGILMYGKRPGVREILRWVRQK